MSAKTLTENEVLQKIERAFRRQGIGAAKALKLSIGDDAALLRQHAKHEEILTCDWSLEGTHFLRDQHPADSVGWKCLARAVSDIAAMGGQPTCFLLSLALPASHTGRWFEEFLGGLVRASRTLRCPLAGGDTTKRNEILINIMVAGSVPAGRAVLRSGAKPGDLIFVSGVLGEAEYELHKLRASKAQIAPKSIELRRHLYPEPRLALGQWLAEKQIANAMMDLSDGLSSDLPRLCAASGVGARIMAAKIPIHGNTRALVKRRNERLQLALHGGDDYELLFTISPAKAKRLASKFRGLPLTCIGEITGSRNILLIDETGRETRLAAAGWDPFRGASQKR
jgi:thiamine-monophosphate kinase